MAASSVAGTAARRSAATSASRPCRLRCTSRASAPSAASVARTKLDQRRNTVDLLERRLAGERGGKRGVAQPAEAAGACDGLDAGSRRAFGEQVTQFVRQFQGLGHGLAALVARAAAVRASKTTAVARAVRQVGRQLRARYFCLVGPVWASAVRA